MVFMSFSRLIAGMRETLLCARTDMTSLSKDVWRMECSRPMPPLVIFGSWRFLEGWKNAERERVRGNEWILVE